MSRSSSSLRRPARRCATMRCRRRERGLGRREMMRGDGLVRDDRPSRARPQRFDARAQETRSGRDRSRCHRRAPERDRHRDRLAAHAAARSSLLLLFRCRACGERGDDLVDDGIVRLVARLHGDVGLRIDRFALRQQLLDLVGAAAGRRGAWSASTELRDRPSARPKRLCCRSARAYRVHDRAAAGGQYLRPLSSRRAITRASPARK